MPGVKIRVSTEEAQRAVETLRKDLNQLGLQSQMTEAQVKALETRLMKKLSADTSAMAMERLGKSLHLSRTEMASFKAKADSVDSSMTTARSSVEGFSNSLKIMGGIVATIGLYKLYTEMKELISTSTMVAARVETMNVVLHTVGRNAGLSAGTMDDLVDKVKAMGITTVEAQEAITKMTQAELNLGKATALANVARNAAVIANTNTSDAMGRLIHGIVTLQPEVLKQLGIMVNMEAVYISWAQANDRATASLSQTEKQQIVFNEVLKKGIAIEGAYVNAMETVGKQISSLPRLIAAVKEDLGAVFTPALSALVLEYSKQLKEWNKELTKMKDDGSLQEWARDFADSTKKVADAIVDVGTAIKDHHEGIINFIEAAAGIYVFSKLGAVLGAYTTGTIAATEKTLILKSAMKGLALGTAAVAGYEIGSWLFDQFSGVSKINEETEALKKYNAEQKKILKERTQQRSVGDKGSQDEITARELKNAKAVKDFKSNMEQQIDAERKKFADIKKKAEEEDVKYLEKWNEIKITLGKAGLESAMATLDVEYSKYQKVVEDKVSLDKWYAAEKNKIEGKIASEVVSLYEQLWKTTGQSRYAETAIEMTKKILDAEQAKWQSIGLTEDQAYLLRIKKEEEYVAAIYKGEDAVLAKETEIAQQRIQVAEQVAEAKQATNAGVGEYTGMSVGSGTRWTEYKVGNQTYYDQASADAAIKSISDMYEAEAQHKADMWRYDQEIQDQERELSEKRTAMEKAQIEGMKRLNEENEKYTETIKNIDLDKIANAGKVTDLNGLMSSVYGAYGSIGMGDQVNATRLSLMRGMFANPSIVAGMNPEDIMSNMSEYISLLADSYSQEISARQSIIDVLKEESGFRERMSYSELAPSSSYQAIMAAYESKISGATTAEGYQDFMSFLESDFLPYMKSYTGAGKEYNAIWSSIFESGGTLDTLSDALGGNTTTENPLVTLQETANIELTSIVGLLGEGGSLHSVLSTYAANQAAYATSFLAAMKPLADTKQSVIDTATYSASTALNTTLLQNLIKFIGQADVYEVGGSYYNSAQVKALAEEASKVGGAFQLATGGQYYTNLSQIGSPKSVVPVEVSPGKYEMPAVQSPPAQVALPAYQVGSEWYTKNFLEQTVSSNASATGKYNFGGNQYTTEQLQGILAGAATYKPKDFGFSGSTTPYTPQAPTWEANWGTGTSGFNQGNKIIATYPYSVSAPSLSYPGWDRFEPTWELPSWAHYDSETGKITGLPSASLSGQIGDYITFSLGGTVWSGNYSQAVTPKAVSVPIAAPKLFRDKWYPKDNYGEAGMRTEGYTGRWNSVTNQWYGKGGLTNGPSGAGELGREWIVPTYEPQRSSFLSDVGVDSEEIANAIARILAPLMGPSNNGKQEIVINLDGKEFLRAIVRNAKKVPEFAEAVRGIR